MGQRTKVGWRHREHPSGPRLNFFTNFSIRDRPLYGASAPMDSRATFSSMYTGHKPMTWKSAIRKRSVQNTCSRMRGNIRNTAFDLSIAPGDDSRNELGFYVQVQDLYAPTLSPGSSVDAWTNLPYSTTLVFSAAHDVHDQASTGMAHIRATGRDHTFRDSYNKAFRAPSLVNNFLDVTILQSFDLGLINPALAGQQFVFPIQAPGTRVSAKRA